VKTTIAAAFLCALISAQPAFAADPTTAPAKARKPIPPPAPADKVLAGKDLEEINTGLDQLAKEIATLKTELAGKPELLADLPDVMIFEKAVRFPLADGELVEPAAAKKAIAEGLDRAAALHLGKPFWTHTSGVRGYISQIDSSVQPYQLDLPAEMPADHAPWRVDMTFHGRDETLTELKFVGGKSTPSNGKIVLKLYGRSCNASKFAGEIDALEALADVKRRYRVDNNRILDIGFSMGGASAWQFATHYSDMFAAASPGAGFAESAQFLHLKPEDPIAWYERVLWHLHDCTDYAVNLRQTPTIAYAGEIDPQKQSSDIMMAAMAQEGLTLQRLIGPNTKHAYEKATKVELDHQLDKLLEAGRNPAPDAIRFTTWTLRYNHMFWITIDGMERQWMRARADASLLQPADCCTSGFGVKTQNVTALTLNFGAGECPAEKGKQPTVQLDGVSIVGTPVAADGSYKQSFVKSATGWTAAPEGAPTGLRKIHNLQGPIDDAFLSHFVFVRPTGTPFNEKTAAWEKEEFEHATSEWRRQFRGEAPIKDDVAITDDDIASGNLICFGDPSSNKILAKVAGKLPIGWTVEKITLGDQSFSAGDHAPILIYPNPLNPARYLVINSGFTFRENDYTSNAKQTPKLPDYAVVDVTVPPGPSAPGGISAAGFFDEQWQLQPDGGEAVLSTAATKVK
jgi:hypothetical protein